MLCQKIARHSWKGTWRSRTEQSAQTPRWLQAPTAATRRVSQQTRHVSASSAISCPSLTPVRLACPRRLVNCLWESANFKNLREDTNRCLAKDLNSSPKAEAVPSSGGHEDTRCAPSPRGTVHSVHARIARCQWLGPEISGGTAGGAPPFPRSPPGCAARTG